MKATEQETKTPTAAWFGAMLGGLPWAKGTGAPGKRALHGGDAQARGARSADRTPAVTRTTAITIMSLLMIALTAASASAAPLTFGKPGQGAGQINNGQSVAVDDCTNLGVACTPIEDPSVGDVYVAHDNNQRVDKFSASGEF